MNSIKKISIHKIALLLALLFTLSLITYNHGDVDYTKIIKKYYIDKIMRKKFTLNDVHSLIKANELNLKLSFDRPYREDTFLNDVRSIDDISINGMIDKDYNVFIELRIWFTIPGVGGRRLSLIFNRDGDCILNNKEDGMILYDGFFDINGDGYIEKMTVRRLDECKRRISVKHIPKHPKRMTIFTLRKDWAFKLFEVDYDLDMIYYDKKVLDADIHWDTENSEWEPILNCIDMDAGEYTLAYEIIWNKDKRTYTFIGPATDNVHILVGLREFNKNMEAFLMPTSAQPNVQQVVENHEKNLDIRLEFPDGSAVSAPLFHPGVFSPFYKSE